jgi:hypothetical protein
MIELHGMEAPLADNTGRERVLYISGLAILIAVARFTDSPQEKEQEKEGTAIVD